MASPTAWGSGEGRVECSTCYLPCSLWKVTCKAQTQKSARGETEGSQARGEGTWGLLSTAVQGVQAC